MSPTRFFIVIAGPGPVFGLAALTVVAFSAYLSVIGLSGFDPSLGIALFLQLFAASTGYRDRLRRGHFDPILVARASNAAIASSHWLVSIALGLIVWVAVGLIGAFREGGWPTAFSASAIAVFLYVSTVVWALSLPLGRYSGGVLWLIALFILASTRQLQALRESSNPLAVLACPVLVLADNHPASGDVAALVLGGLAAWTLGAVAVRSFQAILVEG